MGHGHKDLLRRPLLDDHVSRGKAIVRRTLEVVCVLCVVFMLCFIFDHGDLRIVFICHTFFHAHLTVNVCEEGKSKLLQMARVHIAKIKPDPI